MTDLISVNKVANLADQKEKRKLEVIVDDLDTVLYLLKLIKTGLLDYSCYIPVRNIVIEVTQNEHKLKTHLKNIKAKLEKIYSQTE